MIQKQLVRLVESIVIDVHSASRCDRGGIEHEIIMPGNRIMTVQIKAGD